MPATLGQSQIPPLTPEQQQRLKERDRYDQESADLEKANKLPQAIAAAEKMLAIEREVFGDVHPEVVGSLQLLARVNEALEDFTAAEKHLNEIVGLQTKLYGATSWQVVDARQDLRYLNKLKSLDAVAREELKEAARWQAQAKADSQVGAYEKGAEHAEKAHLIRLRLLGSDWSQTGATANWAGFLWEKANHKQKAKQYLDQALSIRKKVLGDHHPDTATSLNVLGIFLFRQGDYDGARPFFEQALTIFQEARGNDHADTAQCLGNLGFVYQGKGDYIAARLCYEKALAILRKVHGDNHPSVAVALTNLGSLLKTQEDFDSVLPYFQQALAIYKKVLGDNHPDTATAINNMGVMLAYQGNFAAARQHYERALAIRKKVLGADHLDNAATLDNLGDLLVIQGDFASAGPYWEQALAIRKKILPEDHPDVAHSLKHLAFLRQRQGDQEGGKRYFEQALTIYKKVHGETHEDVATCLDNLAGALLNLGDFAEARKCFEQALAIRKKILPADHPHTASSLSNIGYMLQIQGNFAGARLYYEQSLAIFRKALGDNYPNTAAAFKDLGALCHLSGDNAGASAAYLQALKSFRACLNLAAESQAERQQLRMDAMVRFQLDAFLSLASLAKLPPAEAYAQVLAWKGSITARQRLLKRALWDNDNRTLASELQQTTNKLANLVFAASDANQRDKWVKQIEELTKEKERRERELAEKSPNVAKSLKEPRLDDLLATLPAGAALVDFVQYEHRSPAKDKGKWTFENRLLAFVCRSSSGVTCVELGPLKPIEEIIGQWRQQTKEKYPKAGAELRRLLWQPLEKHLEGATTVLVSPDGVLNQFPLAALPGKAAGSYLIEERAVVVVPLARWLPQMLQMETKLAAENEGPSMLLLGDVDFAAADGAAKSDQAAITAPRAGLFKDWTKLPGTRGEIVVIRDSFEQHFATGKLKLLRGPAATKSAVQEWAPKHQILHLATHGFFAPAEVKSALALAKRSGDTDQAASLFDTESISGFNPGLLSGIVLAGANRTQEPGQDDGILTALAVQELDLRQVELVVLSACETGLGQVAGGEGILGLQRSFQVAGAKTVIASLWTVDDEATRKLMERFYENLWSKKLSKGEALRQAQIAMLRGELVRGVEVERESGNRLPPYYWAAFVVSGDWR